MSYPRGNRSDHDRHIDTVPPGLKFGDRDALRVIEEAGAEEEFHADGSLRWRRILRRRTTDLPPASSRQAPARGSRTSGPGLGIVAASVVTQVVFWTHMGAIMLGHEQLGPGRGGAVGFLAGSALATIIIWRIGRR
jgi:hypothetical protein